MAIGVSGVSIGVVFHNEEERILKCLSSLLEAYRKHAKHSPIPVEFIFVDNASTTSSAAVVEKFCLENDLPFQLYFTETNNMGRARNKVISAAKYAYLIFLDADCCPQKDWIQKYLEAADKLKNEKWAALGGENLPPKLSQQLLYRCQRLLKMNSFLFLQSTQLLQAKEVKQVLHVPTCNVLYNLEILKTVGGFHDFYSRVGEDLQLSARLIQAGWKIIFIPDVAVEHFDKTDFKSWFLKSFRYGTVQPRVLATFPKFTNPLRWTPFLLLLVIAGMVATAPQYVLAIAVMGGVLFPLCIALLNKEWKIALPWILFLNGTVIGYCLGYVVGVCKIVLQPSIPQNEVPIGEID